MSGKRYIPSNDARFSEWAENLYAEAVKGFTKWMIAAPELFLETPLEAFQTKLAKLADPNHGKIDKTEKDVARRVLEKACRDYVQGFLARNPLVTDVDRERLGITVRDVIPTSVGLPQGLATADVKYVGGQVLQLHIKHITSTPFDEKANYGFKIHFGLFAAGEPHPETGRDLPRSRFTRRKKEIFRFAPTDVTKTAYFCIRYENGKGEPGAWGPMFSAVIVA